MSFSRHILAVVLIIIACNLSVLVAGYKWVPLGEGSKLPSNLVVLNPNENTYVGRLIKLNVIIPAEIYNGSYAIAFGPKTGKYVVSENIEILTSSELCKWNEIDDLSDVPENVVRVGKSWNREPIYFGKTSLYDAASILLSSRKFISPKEGIFRFALTCGEDKAKWIYTIPPAIPQNAVQVKEGSFVARLVGPVSFITAQMFNNSHWCSAFYKDVEMKSDSCEVLVGDSKSAEYSWQFPSKFEVIPENALVIGKSLDDELIYATRDESRRLRSSTFSDLQSMRFPYAILIRN